MPQMQIPTGQSPVTSDPSSATDLQTSALQGATDFAAQQDPVRYAMHLELMKMLGKSSAVGQGNVQQVQQQADANRLDPRYLTTMAPMTSAWASNPDNAAVSGVDEIHRLAGIEQNAAGMRTATEDNSGLSFSNFHNPFSGIDLGDLKSSLMDAITHPLETLLGADTPSTAAQKEAVLRQAAKDTGDPFLQKASALQDFEKKPLVNVSGQPKFQNTFDPKSQNIFSRMVTGGTKSIEALTSPDNLELLGTMPFAPENANPILSSVFGGQMAEGSAAGAIDTAHALSSGNYGDAAEAGVGTLLNAGFALHSAKSALIDRVSGELAANKPSSSSPLDTAMQSSSYLGNLAEAVGAGEASKLRERAPDRYYEALQGHFEGDPGIRIPSQAFTDYFQGNGNDPAQVARGLGSTNYPEAVLSGGDVQVPAADFLAKLDPEHQKALLPDVVDPSVGMTARQNVQAHEELKQWMADGGLERMQAEAAQADAETADSPEYSAVKEDLRQRYVDAGETPEVADTLATKDANVYSNLAKQAGMKPSELLSYYNPKVVLGETPDGDGAQEQVLHQQRVDDIREVVLGAKEPGHAPQKAILAPVKPWISDAAKANGLDIEGYTHVIDGSAVRHTLNRHGDVAAEQARGGIPVTDADFDKIPDVVDSPDRVILGLKTKGRKEAIGYLKRLDDGTTLHLEEVRTGKKELAAVSMRKYPAAKDLDDIAANVPSYAQGDGGTKAIVVEPPSADKYGDTLHQDGIDYGAALRQKIADDPAAAEAEYNSLPDTKGGRLLNTDEARELSEHYREDRTRSADVHEPASQFIKDLYAKRLAQPVGEGREPLVLFTAGGTGAGKSTSLRTEGGAPLENAADIIYDTNMNTFDSADSKIQQALKSGRNVHVQYTYRDPVEALTGGMLPRAMRMGRTVPLSDHLNTHVGARQVIDQLQAKYADDPRVRISAVDNSRGRNNSRDVRLDAVPQIEENGLRERLQNALRAEHAAGRISDRVKAGVEAGSDVRRLSQLQGLERGVRKGSGGHDQPERDEGPLVGRSTTLLTPSGRLPARYALVEASDLVPSHDPHTFAVNPQYPAGVQERAYDTSKEAQARVIDQAQNYEPAYTVNTNPDAVNGPPVVTRDGVVLGGNSRAMSTMRLYSDGNGEVYREAVKRQAAEFGLSPEAVDGMKEPVLVRRVDAPNDTESLRRLGTDLNRSMTGALGTAEKSVSAGKNIRPETLRTVSGMLQEGDTTLRELMASHGPKLVQMLVGDGVITDRERPQYVDAATGGLNEAGKSFVEKALLGSVMDDPRTMESAPKAVLNKIERSLGAITSFSSRADEWNILPTIREAVGELGAIQRAGSTVDLWTGQASMFGGERNPVVDAMVRALDGKPNAVREAFESFSRDADTNLPGQARMFGEANAFEAFNHAFGSNLTEQEFTDGIDRARTNSVAAADAHGGGDLPEVSAGGAGAGGEELPGEVGGGASVQPRGWFRVLPDGSYEIGKTKIGDLSTFVHEPAHAYLKMIGDLAQREGASDTLKGDYQKILDYLGAKAGEPLTREQQETWARANEQYLREGKAPSPGLRGAFQRFAVWLGSIYHKASDLGVTLTGDIRGVFDRLYATEEGVNRVEAEGGPHLFTSPEEAGWTEEQFKNYADMNQVSVEQAKSQILGMLNEAALRDKTQAWREEERNVREAVTAHIDQKPEYAAMRALRKGKLDDGTELTLNRDELVKQFGEQRVKELQRQHPGLYRNEGGIDTETAAEILGFNSADSMLKTLEAAPRRSAAIEQATREYMTAKHGDIRYDGTLGDQARIALENDKRADVLHSELTALKQKVAAMKAQDAGRKEAMKAISVAPIASYREAARQMVETKAPADLQPRRYLDASRKYSREAFDALRKGDVEAAANAKHKELMNHFLFSEAVKGKEYVGKFESYVKRMGTRGVQQKLGLAGEDYRDQFNRILGRYGIGPSVQAERSLADWAKAQYDMGKEPAIDPAILNEGRTVNYRNAPLSEIRAVHDALVNVRKLASLELGMEVNGRKVEFNAAVESMVAAAREHNKVRPESVFEENVNKGEVALDYVNRGLAPMVRTEFLMKRLDGGVSGPWHDNLWNLAADAQGTERKLQTDVVGRIGDALENVPKEQRARLMDKVSVPGIDESMTRKRLISMAFNMGNEGNLDRLRKTFEAHGWNPDAVESIKGMLTRAEWQFVQDGWDSLKPLGQAQAELERRLTGLPPVMVEPTPLRFRTADGADMELAGGYYPVAMDPRFSARGATQDAGTTAQNLMETGYTRAVTSRGNMKERTGFGGPLQLDYEQVLTQHIAKVTKDISHRELVLVANRLLMEPRLREALRETVGEGYEKQMMPWLRTLINDTNGSAVQGLGDLSNWMAKLRANVVEASLGFKVSTILLQLTHASSMFLHTSKLSYAKSFRDFMAHPMKMTEQIRSLSPNEMQNRGENLDRDLRKVMQDGISGPSVGQVMAKAAMYPVMVMDHVLSFPLWLSAYREAQAENAHLPESEANYLAMHKADGAVRMGLGSNAPKDLPSIMRKNDFFKTVTMLGGFHNLKLNQILDVGNDFARDRDVGKFSYGMMMTALIPAVVGAYITGRGPKDGENPAEWAAIRALLFAPETIPVLGDIFSGLENHSDIKFSPILTVVEKAAKAGLETFSSKEDKDWTGIGLDAGEAGGDLLGVPGTTQVARTLRYMNKMSQGRIEDPNVWDAVMGQPHR